MIVCIMANFGTTKFSNCHKLGATFSLKTINESYIGQALHSPRNCVSPHTQPTPQAHGLNMWHRTTHLLLNPKDQERGRGLGRPERAIDGAYILCVTAVPKHVYT